MKNKLDTLRNAFLIQTGINISKALEILIVVPLLIKYLDKSYSDYLYFLSLLNFILFFDFNLQNYGVNLLYKKKSDIIKISFYSGYLRLFIPLTLIYIIFITLFNNSLISIEWIIMVLFMIFNFISAQLGSLLSSTKGFFYTNTISLVYNYLTIFLIIFIVPNNLNEFVLIKLFTSIILILSLLTTIKKYYKNFKIYTTKKLNFRSYKKIKNLLVTTKEYTFQKIIEFINANFLALIIIPIDKVLGLQLIVIKSLFSISVFATNFFVSIYQQMFLNDGNKNFAEISFRLINILYLIVVIFILLFIYDDLLLLIKNYYNFDSTFLTIKPRIVLLISLLVFQININKQMNIKRNTRLMSLNKLMYPVILYLITFLALKFFNITKSPELIILLFLVCEFFYYLTQKIGFKK